LSRWLRMRTLALLPKSKLEYFPVKNSFSSSQVY
jgi:hypothetical protein